MRVLHVGRTFRFSRKFGGAHLVQYHCSRWGWTCMHLIAWLSGSIDIGPLLAMSGQNRNYKQMHVLSLAQWTETVLRFLQRRRRRACWPLEMGSQTQVKFLMPDG